MKRASVAVILTCMVVLNAYGAEIVFGTVDYVEGAVTLTRSSKLIGDLAIGDAVSVNDMIKTGTDGVVIIALDKRTGMRGTLNIKQKTVVYIRLTEDKTSPKTTIELIAGQVASKVAKLSGSPTMSVMTSSAVMGVRGTEYGVSTSVNGSIMIYCLEGAVECKDEAESLMVTPGKALDKRASERMRFLPAAISSPEEFEKKWIADEIEVFKGGAAKFLKDYEKRYTTLIAEFNAAFDVFQKSPTLAKWLSEDRDGKTPGTLSAEVMREKKEMMGHIQKMRKNLFIFERIYYRIDQIAAIVGGTALEKLELRSGVKVSDFMKRFKADQDALAKKVAMFRFGEKLYELRNQGGAGLPGMDGLSDDDFFGSDGF